MAVLHSHDQKVKKRRGLAQNIFTYKKSVEKPIKIISTCNVYYYNPLPPIPA